MDFLNFLMALSPIVVVLVGILGFKKSAKTVSPVALLWTLILAFTYILTSTVSRLLKTSRCLTLWSGRASRKASRSC